MLVLIKHSFLLLISERKRYFKCLLVIHLNKEYITCVVEGLITKAAVFFSNLKSKVNIYIYLST